MIWSEFVVSHIYKSIVTRNGFQNPDTIQDILNISAQFCTR